MSEQHADAVPMGDAPEWIEHLRVARLARGDKLVLQCPEILTAEGAEQIMAHMRRCFPGYECVILSGGMELGVMRQSDGRDDG